MQRIPTTNILNDKIVNVFPQIRNKKGCPLSSLYFSGIGLTSTIRQENEINDIKIRKEDTKLYLLIDDMIVYLENLKELTNNWN